MPPITPPENQESSGLGWLGYGAGSLAALTGAFFLGKNKKAIYKMGEMLDASRSVLSETTALGRETLREQFGKVSGNIGSQFEQAGRSPAATKALNPEIFDTIRGAISAWESGIPKERIQGAIKSKFGQVTTLENNVRNLQIKDITEAFQKVAPDEPFNLYGRSINPEDASLLKKATDLGIVDKNWAADQGMFFKGDGIVDANVFRPEKWAESLVKGMRAITGGVLTDTLLPSTHLLKSVPDITEISTEGLGKHIKDDTLERAFKVGDEILGITKEDSIVELPKLKVGPVGNAISKAHAIRKGLVKHKSVDDIKKELAEIGEELSPRMEKIYRAAENKYYSSLVGMGPQYSSEQAVPKRLVNWLKRFYQTDIKPISAVPGETVEETWKNLSIADKIKVTAKMDTDRILWSRTSIVGEADARSFEQIQEIKRQKRGLQWEDELSPFGRRKVSQAEKLAANNINRDINDTIAQTYYAYDSSELLGNWLHAAFTTPFRIAGAQFGLGLKHDSLGKTALRATVGVPMAGYVAWQGANYLDYLVEETTTMSPMRGAVRAYAEAQIMRQNMLNLLAISHASELSENLLGIDLDSPAAIAARSLGLPILGAKLGKSLGPGMGRPGFFVGAGLAGLTFTDNLSQDADELRDIYEGRKEVSIRKSRFWGLGSDPFEGGDVSYYRPHLVASMLSEPSITEAEYGSESQYWSHGTMFPTPHNVFGLGIIVDPYWHERKHYHDRPYPVSGGLMEEFPIWGNILDATIGEVIKPTKVMHENEIEEYIRHTPEFSGDKGLENVSKQLGLHQIKPGKVLPRVEGVQDDLGHAIYDVTEFAGLKGFLFTSFKKQVTGSPDFSDRGARWASADSIYSKAGAYYDMQLGGLLGYTELGRRFLPHRQSQIDYVNPLKNTMPSWVPGENSSFGDNDYINFSEGDPYSHIPEGEKRLPGPAYEAVHELHSGKEGTYDAFDRMRILADVSPYSNAFKYYKNIVDDMAESGQLDEKWMNIYSDIDERIKGKGLPQFDNEVSSRYSLEGFGSTTEWLGSMIDIRIPYVGTKLMGAETDPLREYEEKVVYDNDFHDWRRPIDAMLIPYMRAQSARGVVSGSLGGATLGLVSGLAGGTHAGMVGATGAVIGGVWGAAGVGNPENEIRRRSMEEYFDKLEYIKLQKLKEQAEKKGELGLANKLSRMSKRTMVGLDYSQDTTSFYKSAYSSLPKPDRQYLQAFIEADPNKRSEILDKIPSYMQPIMLKLWENPNEDKRAAGVIRRYENRDALQSAMQYVQSHGGVPDEGSQIWHPDVSIEDVKLKTIQSLGADIHNYGFWGTDERDLNRSRAYIKPLPFSYKSNTYQSKKLNFYNNMVQYGFDDSYVDLIRNPGKQPENVYSINIKRNRLGDIAMFESRSESRF